MWKYWENKLVNQHILRRGNRIKSSKEIIAQFENLDTVEKTQLLSISVLKDKLKDPLKLLGIDTSVKKRKTSKLQNNIVESVKEGLHSIGKKLDV